MLLWFEGADAPADLLDLLRARSVGGVTLFRHLNGGPPAQVRALTDALQAAARAGGRPPLLICADQEGGQLQAIGGTTAFPGNMALGAAGDADLARRVGAAIGVELAAVGVNVDYAPACDVNVEPRNPVIGVRSFGEAPALVARLAAAMVAGLQGAGVAAVAKHFPGHGDTAQDSHDVLSALPHTRDRLDAVDLPPFVAAIAAGVRLVMSAHLALPAITGRADLPATLAPEVLRGLLRDQLGFAGVTVSDAMNMSGLGNTDDFGPLAVRAAAAGLDLLLLAEPNDHRVAHAALLAAAADGRLPADDLIASAGRVRALKGWLAGQAQPALDVIGCAAHRALAAEASARAITLVRDEAGRLPLRLPAEARVAVVVPQTADLTPADTSSYERCELARAVRRHHPAAEELVMPADPSPAEVDALCARLAGCDLAIVGTINAGAQAGQAALVRALLAGGTPVIAAALRLPYDLAAYPAAPTYLCAYSILPPAMDALADAIWGRAPITGRLPARIPGLYPLGHGVSL
nr:glycoside hydrolase family 3 N-terminal domain-containing protein [Oscillochloris sp. ZM17-4]